MCLPQTEFKVTVWSVWMFKIPVAPQSLVFSTAPDASVPQACTPDRKIKYYLILVFCSEELSFLSNKTPKKSIHCWFLAPWNREKSLTLIWQKFSCLLDEWIAKIIIIKKSRWLFELSILRWTHGQSNKSENIFGIWY